MKKRFTDEQIIGILREAPRLRRTEERSAELLQICGG